SKPARTGTTSRGACTWRTPPGTPSPCARSCCGGSAPMTASRPTGPLSRARRRDRPPPAHRHRPDRTERRPEVNTLDLDTLTLAAGCHDPGDEMCVMEAVAFIAGEKWTDQPECASPVIGAFMRAWNDALPGDDRQDLKRFIPRLVDSRGTPEQEDLRGWMALDWLVRVHTPAWLRLAGLTDQADRLAGLAEIRPDTVQGVKPALDA